MENMGLAIINLMLYRSLIAQTLFTLRIQINLAEPIFSTQKPDNRLSNIILKQILISLIFLTKTCKRLHHHSQLHNRLFSKIHLKIDRRETLCNLDNALQI